MKIIIGTSNNPYFNLAMEEYFLKQKNEDYFMLWQNDKSVIIGKNQNAYAEINHKYVTENNIKVVRRMTGGGAVFHDLGNINYTFIKRNSKDAFNDYRLFSEPIIAFLKSLGVDAYLSGRNDMLIEDKKFSGNAQCAYKESVMHHGTLLFSSEKSDISESLNINPLKIASKGISSVKSRVTNISEHLKNDISVKKFMDELTVYIKEYFNENCIYKLSDEDEFEINKLADSKYSTNQWNYGFKYDYTVFNEKKFSFGLVQISVLVKNNIIDCIKIYGDFFGENDIGDMEILLTGTAYLKENIKTVLFEIPIDKYIKGMKIEELLDVIF